MGKHPVAVLDWCMAAETLLDEVCILAVGLLFLAKPAGKSPTAGRRIFLAVLDHEFRVDERTGFNGGPPLFMLAVFPDHLGQHGPFGPGIGLTFPGGLDGHVVAERGPDGVVVGTLVDA